MLDLVRSFELNKSSILSRQGLSSEECVTTALWAALGDDMLTRTLCIYFGMEFSPKCGNKNFQRKSTVSNGLLIRTIVRHGALTTSSYSGSLCCFTTFCPSDDHEPLFGHSFSFPHTATSLQATLLWHGFRHSVFEGKIICKSVENARQ